MNWKYLKSDLEYRWQNLQIRKWINDNPNVVKITAPCSVLILLVVVLCLIWPEGEQKYASIKKAWYYDLNTAKLFISDAHQNPPIDAPSGPLPDSNQAGVLAYVYRTGMDKNSTKIIAFLEKLTDKAQKTRPRELGPPDKRTEQEIQLWNRGRLIKRVDGKHWVFYESPQGQIILNELARKIQQNNLILCYPSDF